MIQPSQQLSADQADLHHDFFTHTTSGALIIAHRGFRACYPENTLAAFTASLGRCGMIELDVQLSRDDAVVVYHDPTLTRTSDALTVAPSLGMDSMVLAEWKLEQLRELDCGSWFLQDDPYGTIRQGIADAAELQRLGPQRIMVLGELLDWAMARHMPLNIEMKRQDHPERGLALVHAVVKDIRSASAMNRVLVSSFDHDYLRICRRVAPEMALAALQEGSHPPELIPYLQSLGVCGYHPENGIVDSNLVRTIRSANLHLNVFTVNEKARQRQLSSWGVTGIFTDYLMDSMADC